VSAHLLSVMQFLATSLFVLAAIVNLVPVSGVVSVDRLHALYGLSFDEPNLVILMRHRAVLFGIVGALLLAAAFHPPLRGIALAAGLVSMLSFVVLAWAVGDYNADLRRVALVDVAASVLLVAGGILGTLAVRP